MWDCDYHPALDVNYAKIEWFYDHQSMVKLSFYLGIYGCKWSLIVLYGSKYLYQIGYNRVLISFSLQPSWALLKTPVKSEQCIYPKDFYLSLKQFIKVHTIIIDCKLIVTDNHFVLLSFKCILKMYSQATLKRDWVWFYCWNAKKRCSQDLYEITVIK